MGVKLAGTIDSGWQEPDEKGRKLCPSGFNPIWFQQLGIVPTVIFDVGSFDGADALRLKRVYPKATVITFDADPVRAQVIRKNLEGENVRFIEAAVIDRIGTVKLHHAGDRSENGSRCASVFQWTKKPFQELVTVDAITIESVCMLYHIRHIDLLHMDIEGAELLAIRGLGAIRPRLIWAEVHDGWIGAPGSAETHAGIISLGYRQLLGGKDRLYLRAGRKS